MLTDGVLLRFENYVNFPFPIQFQAQAKGPSSGHDETLLDGVEVLEDFSSSHPSRSKRQAPVTNLITLYRSWGHSKIGSHRVVLGPGFFAKHNNVMKWPKILEIRDII